MCIKSLIFLTSYTVLEEMDIKNSVKLHRLNRFRRTRNNANYRGYTITPEEAKEIVDFWGSCAKELISMIEISIK